MKKSIKKTFSRSRFSKVVSNYKYKILIPAVMVIGGIFGYIRTNSLQMGQVYEVAQPVQGTSHFQSAVFPGNSFIFVNNGNQIVPNMANGFTAEAWVKPATAEYPLSTIITQSDGSDYSHVGFTLDTKSWFSADSNQYNVTYTFIIGTQGCTTQRFVGAQVKYDKGQENLITSWHHVAGVLQPSGEIQIYLDGKKSTLTPVDQATILGVCNESKSVYVGVRPTTYGYTDYFKGQMDDLNITDAAIYSGDFDPSILNTSFTYSGDQLLYFFDGNLNDSSQYHRDGTSKGTIMFVGENPYPKESPIPPSPVVSAKPSPTPYCYTTGRMCIAVVGQVCPTPWTVCTSPTPTPTIKPIPMPSPVCKTISNCSVSGCMAKKQCKSGSTVVAKCNRTGTRVKCQTCTNTVVCSTPAPKSPVPSPSPKSYPVSSGVGGQVPLPSAYKPSPTAISYPPAPTPAN